MTIPIPASPSDQSAHTDIIDTPSQTFPLKSLQLSPSQPAPLCAALQKWVELLGTENVDGPDTVLQRYYPGALPKKYLTRPAGAVRPANRDQVVAVVKIARAYGIPLHAISRGQNWGYGGPLPPRDGMAIVDLSRMNRIIEVNTELAYAVIEPGVTQRQLFDYLRTHQIPLVPDATGAGPEASLVGNILQRGFGHTPYGNRVLHAANYEVVLPDGRVIETGFGKYENAKAKHVFPYGRGPWVDGLFTQSALGIVTRMTIWLLPAPKALIGFALKVPEEHQIAQIVERLRPLCLNGTVRSTVHIANDLRVISAKMSYPYSLTDGRTPLPDAVRKYLRRKFGVGAWNLMGGLYGSRGMTRQAAREIRQAFHGLAPVFSFGRRLLSVGRRLAEVTERLRIPMPLAEAVRSADSVYRLLQGEPSDEHLKGVFWRHRLIPSDFHPRAAGALWCSPVLPMRGEDVLALLRIVRPIYERHQLEPLITFSAVTSRALVGVFSICYDPEDSIQVRQAEACYEELSSAICRAGYYPYRGMIPHSSDPYFWDAPSEFLNTLFPASAFYDTT
ncbi:FAD-binding oxidoreductase [Thermogutta sp.]|uniref:FAD-binding oxidoreductase n=1 Tax=Thermogutta sp. TaxID=1962930 RepID=UPI003C79F0BE